uniref:Elongation of very long chain fatty acids protein n=1 Tax=Sus scrofa TaxID=9823 RepID=A0A8D1VEZ5_PIG
MNMSVLTLQEYEFEKQFNENEAIQWMQENWKKSFLVSALYAAFIFGGRHVMNKRAKFELRKPLVLWSLSLAVFRRYNIHHSEEAEADLPALVPPHHCAPLLLVLLQGHGGRGRLVHDHELWRALGDVLLLRLASGGVPSVPEVCHVHHLVPDHSDAGGLCRQLPGLPLDAARPVLLSLSEHLLVLAHVPQLPCALLPLLL